MAFVGIDHKLPLAAFSYNAYAQVLIATLTSDTVRKPQERGTL
ncbi:hypothetical protein [Scytonema sp. HK-05]|nr:hypothetical protein [Scytonema sp. HK-05]